MSDAPQQDDAKPALSPTKVAIQKRQKQNRRFYGWCIFSVLLPLATYLVTILSAYFFGVRFSVIALLARGDLLFLVIVHLATLLNWTALSFVDSPRTDAGRLTSHYVWFAVCLLLLILFAMLYGNILIANLSPDLKLANPESFAICSAVSVVCVSGLCGGRFYLLLREERL